ncbi:MAG: DUF58 domain-containing protein [Candidatus Abyssobacteria bacterium SURF_17]|uniref:DUF58 domain-containing protein n=1 Tax=Candidatus Abyssobacteria bacterium SURF_17 TaxID=2093361 RepID=A0A419ETZ8_9BACT|nr:MAG: DUF58 domain-containing protein [Candidatus Abyssubacteria bacterium SURF_17]
MLPKEIFRKIRRIQIYTTRTVNDVLAGQYRSVFKGRGIEFAEVREYQVGDDVRMIDWNVTARMGRPYVKQFSEERELTAMLLVDLSASGRFGSVELTKNEMAAEIAALLAFSAIRNNDKVGLIIFTDRVEKFVAPQKGRSHVLRVIREILYFRPAGKGTDIAAAIEYLMRISTRRTVAFLISDFIASGYQKKLRAANKRHDMIAFRITDPRETELPRVGLIRLEDPETGGILLVDTRSEKLRRNYERAVAQDRAKQLHSFRSMNVDTVDLRTDSSYIEPLVRFFRMRERRLATGK